MSIKNATRQNSTVHSTDALVSALEFSKDTGRRAVNEAFEIVLDEDGRQALVRNTSHGDSEGHEYLVDLDAAGVPRGCVCPAKQYHCEPGESCKHELAVALRMTALQEDR